MIHSISKQFYKFAKGCKSISTLIKISLPKYPHRVVSIEQNEEGNYVAVVQVVNKGQIFRIKPEEILACNTMTDSFSQRDIRTLTYLGYLGINSPKYEILAKRLSENDHQMFFSIKERGTNKYFVKTANEISSDQNFITGLRQKDAHMLGYATAIEQMNSEEIQKEKLKKGVV